MMTRTERSQIVKELLSWLDAKSKQGKGATLTQIINHTQLEISEMGSTDRTIRGYIRDLVRVGLIQLKGTRYTTTTQCKNWLQRKFQR